jgi:hypothetical protein
MEDTYSAGSSAKRPQNMAEPSKNEFELLRQKVMESYQRSKFQRQSGSDGHKPRSQKDTTSNMVNLKHVFPTI